MERVAVIGLGYAGLPLAVAFAESGLLVTGIDIDEERVEKLNRGESYVPDVPSEILRSVRPRFKATTDYSVLLQQESAIICVPTPLSKTGEPDISYIISAAKELSRYVHADMLVVLESTTYPGTTDEVLKPMLEAGGLKVGRDLFLAFSPERIDPGNKKYTVHDTPKIVGGVTPACTERALALYRRAIKEVIPVSSAITAETVKLLENSFRAVNIGLINEIALLCRRMGVDVWEVIKAAATKPFGFMPFYPGPGIGGHCLDGRETVCVEDNLGVQILPLEDLFERIKAERRGRSFHLHDVEIIAQPGVQVLSFDPVHQVPRFRPAQYLFRRRYQGAVVTITTGAGTTLRVTDQHPMLVERGGVLEVHPAQKMQVGDRLPLLSRFGETSTSQPSTKINLLDYASSLPIEKIRVRPVKGHWKQHSSVLKPFLKSYGEQRYEFYRRNSIPLSLYLNLRAAGQAPFTDEEVVLITGRGPSHAAFPAVITLDGDFGRLVGYYLSEGCITSDRRSQRVRFSFHRDERELIADVTGILTGLPSRFSLYHSKRWQSCTVKVSSELLAILLRDILGCGTRSENMQIPPQLLGAPYSVRKELLSALLRGDGDVHHTNRAHTYAKRGKKHSSLINSACVGYSSSSPALLRQVAFLAQGLGLLPVLKKGKPQLRFYGYDQMQRLSDMLLGQKREKVQAYMANNRKRMRSKIFHKDTTYATVPVRQLSVEETNGDVYSLEVGDTHTFAASWGIFVHNCIPVDPLFLSWRARAFNFTTRFIELADEINRYMPEYTVWLIMDALNARGKPLKGANVLILGVAYKPDVDDCRESPALDIMENLSKKGAAVFYHDPFVPAISYNGVEWRSTQLSRSFLREMDCVVVLTHHSCFDLNFFNFITDNVHLVVDTRNATSGIPNSKVVRL